MALGQQGCITRRCLSLSGMRVLQWAAALSYLLSKGMRCVVLLDPFACEDSSRTMEDSGATAQAPA